MSWPKISVLFFQMRLDKENVAQQAKRSKPRVLITGVSGLLGSNLAFSWQEHYRILGLYRRNPWSWHGIETTCASLDDRPALQRIFGEFRPQIVVHTAALARLDYCEAHQDEALAVNVGGTETVASLARQHEAKLVYISSDTVYDGRQGNAKETDPTGPLSFYASTKLKGEERALRIAGALVARINIFGWNVHSQRCLAEEVLTELPAGRRIKGFTDVKFCSMYTFDLAELIATALEKKLAGVYNMACSSFLSKYDFAIRLARLAGLDANLIEPISVDDFKLTAKRSKDLSLDMSKFSRDTGISVPTIEQSMERFYRDYRQGIAAQLQSKGSKVDV